MPAAIILVILAPIIIFVSAQEGPPLTDKSDTPVTETTEAETPAPASQPETSPPPPPAITPSSVLGLANWKLTLPVNTPHEGSPDEVQQPELASYSSDQFFHLTTAKDGVVFRANAGGATTSNSGYPRSELREMTNSGKTKASWSNTSGTHTMTVRQAITHLPVVKPELVAAQIHDSSDDVIMVRLEGKHLFIESGGKNIGTLDPAYQLGTVYTVKIEASGGRIKVWYNDALKVDVAKSGSGWYFKAGCYTQSSPKKGESADAYGEVVIYSVSVTH